MKKYFARLQQLKNFETLQISEIEMRVQKCTQVCKEFSMLVFQIRRANIHYSAKMLGALASHLINIRLYH